jgi:hypothetical protein
MTPSDLVLYARQQWNSATDDFFSDLELYSHIWAAQNEMARKAQVIERVYTSSTVIDQRAYDFPTNAIGIKRIEYDGIKLAPISFKEDDTLTLTNTTTTATGTPQYYAIWNRAIYLRPIPDAADTLTIYSYNAPQQVTNSSVLEVPEQFHLDLVEYLLWRKAIKDKNFEAANNFKALWDEKIVAVKEWQRKSKRSDGFTAVQDMDLLNSTILGAV